MKKMNMALLCASVSVALAGCGSQEDHKSKDATSMKDIKPMTVDIVDAKGKKAGSAHLKQVAEGVQVKLHAKGLIPGQHGVHFHEMGVCEAPKFESAGKHFNTTHKQHGFDNPKGPHVGDLQNISANENGDAKGDFIATMVTLAPGKSNSLVKKGGTSLVIHANADDYKTDPSGNSGDRMMCGVIKEK
ncbi:superoxide dismutase copper/zinc binding protein [Fictibacillus macauensis ZFHKF-1]|uniref:Superoxide dismutase copper/zinc binding protein n=1 Tax=Fictibacillus macauensis ZFHKF-1 TaxID=1196324 RepID=I8UJY1_9BACL|nr:superoxide dismutase family protein [Fictibacillus macauensis]EIT87133.1 superoxide dismutase copper/zinc binding protein [Fictibacillus macauensis ZFHKF-1]